MKRILPLLSIFLFAALPGKSQGTTSLHENFDVSCMSATFPIGWLSYDPVSDSGAWVCTAYGRSGTPGMECTGVYGRGYHLDTAYLITPLMNLHSVTGPIYLNFDTKTDSVLLGGSLRVIVTIDTPYNPTNLSVDLTDSLLPALGVIDSSGWATHEVDISRFEDTSHPFYITFRYTSTTSTGSLRFLDNINTTTYPLLTPGLNKEILPLTAVGNSTPDRITISYSAPEAGIYQLDIYDMLGREVYKEMLDAENGTNTHPVTGLGLHPGMYFIKMTGDAGIYGITKTVVN